MLEWLSGTLRAHPEISLFLSLAIGYYIGNLSYRGFSLGAVTSTLVVGLIIGQIGIKIPSHIKEFFLLLFLFAVGYGIGPQFVRGIAKDGARQALFAVTICGLCLVGSLIAARLAGYDAGYAAGLYAGSQTISGSIGIASDAINRLGLPADETKALVDAIPVGYAVTYIFGTVGSAIILAHLGPRLLRIDLAQACRNYEERMEGGREPGSAGSAWRRWEGRAFRLQPGSRAVGLSAAEAEGSVPEARVFIERIRRGGRVEEVTADTVLREGDVLAVAGSRETLVGVVGRNAEEIEDLKLLDIEVEGIDVYVTSRVVDGKTLEELAQLPAARGIFLRRIVRGVTATRIPILANTVINRGDILTIVGRPQDTTAIAKVLGYADRPSDAADVA